MTFAPLQDAVLRWYDASGRDLPWRRTRDPVVTAPRGGRGPAERFEGSDRWVRGRVIAGLASGTGLPADIEPERMDRALRALERDGLLVRDGTSVAFPR